MPRFFVEKSNIYNGFINITGEDVNHIKNVLRLKVGDNIVLSDGFLNDYNVAIDKFEQGLITARIIDIYKNATEPGIEVTLFQGMPKAEKLEFIIQKCIELGVKKIVPVTTERTVVKLGTEKDIEKKLIRWQKISLEAAKQSNRGMIPEVAYPVDFLTALKLAGEGYDLGIIPYENERKSGLKNLLVGEDIGKIAVFIGPEGGFSEKEIGLAVNRSLKPVTLGPRILRTETAGIAVLSILMYELGDANR